MSEDKTRREFMGTTGAAAGLAALAAAFTGSKAQGAVDVTELNAMGPTPEQMQAFMALPDKPVIMLNLLKFDDAAAYQRYGVEVGKILKTIGAELFFSGQCAMTMIGGAEWDAVGMVRYPNAKALLAMAQSEEYQAIHHYREGGLQGQMNIAVFENDGLGEASAEAAADEGVTADQIMSQMDANADGKITMEEAPDQLKGAFGMVDMNADGGIDLSEAQMIADFMNGQ